MTGWTPRYDALMERLGQIEARGQRRHLQPLEMSGPTTGLLRNRPVHVFCSNDYLGLAWHPRVAGAWEGRGAGSARLISGDRPAHHDLEARLSELFGRVVTLLSSGYHANLALLTALLGPDDLVVSDELNHASIIDGVRLSGARKHVAAHGVADVPDGTTLVVVEGLYSMDGDALALKPYRGQHWLAVDEAHAFGAMGLGQAERQGVKADFVVGTLGKAVGAYGGFIVGPECLHELLLASGRSFIYTTGLPEPVVRAALAGVEVAFSQEGDELRGKLADNVARLRGGLADLGLSALGRDHVVPVVLADRTMAVAEHLFARGFWAPGIRPPTVPRGQERIRLAVSALHTAEQVDRLLGALESAPR